MPEMSSAGEKMKAMAAQGDINCIFEVYCPPRVSKSTLQRAASAKLNMHGDMHPRGTRSLRLSPFRCFNLTMTAVCAA